jgi:hypothetical protein
MGAPDLGVDGVWVVIEANPPSRLVQTWRMLMDEDLASEAFTRLIHEFHEGKWPPVRLGLHTCDGNAGRRPGQLPERHILRCCRRIGHLADPGTDPSCSTLTDKCAAVRLRRVPRPRRW